MTQLRVSAARYSVRYAKVPMARMARNPKTSDASRSEGRDKKAFQLDRVGRWTVTILFHTGVLIHPAHFRSTRGQPQFSAPGGPRAHTPATRRRNPRLQSG